MPEFRVNLTNSGLDDDPNWLHVENGATAIVPFVDFSDGGNSASWSIDPSAGSAAGGDSTPAGPASGDAAWVSAEALDRYHTVDVSEASPYTYKIIGPPNADFTVDCFASSTFDRTPRWWLNSGTPQDLPELNNVTNTVTLSGSTDAAGEAFLRVSQAPGSGFAHVNAFRVNVPDGPSVTITQAELTPGGTISGTYADYTTVPTTLTVSDGTNTITIPTPTITDNGDGTGSFSGTMPALPATGTASLILFTNSATVELT